MLTTNVTLAGDLACHGDVVDTVFATAPMGFPSTRGGAGNRFGDAGLSPCVPEDGYLPMGRKEDVLKVFERGIQRALEDPALDTESGPRCSWNPPGNERR
ncbi:hypothetical protein MFU01_63460 [Myxococcus fulvus]|uniref:Uncharacterized protein n=1 Tax=Myxococcus fulvus TaxID=33 RepID=A0A511TAU1_MYXFU|nr:hypothetical protein MFU01_63460 [Myxococcus fulvus]